MIRVTFVGEDGAERTLETAPAGTLMTLAVANAVPGIPAECGGAMACGTCQVFIAPEWADRLGAPSPLEQCLLEVSLTPGPNSRLACQIPLTEQLDGLKVQVAGPAR